MAGGGQSERLLATILGALAALEEAGLCEPSKELRDSRTRHGGPARKLGSRDFLRRDRLERQELTHAEGWIVTGEQALDPAVDQRRYCRQRLDSSRAACSVTRPHRRH